MLADPVDPVIYDIPVAAVPAYRGRRVIVRLPLDRLADEVDGLIPWGAGLPVQLLMRDPAAELSTLYRAAHLVETHAVRVVMPVRPGVRGAVKLATSLEMAVKLEVEQPSPAEIRELAAVLDHYLHARACAQPVEFFHGVLSALYQRRTTTLWAIQDEDPARMLRVEDDGVETPFPPVTLAADDECRTCAFSGVCGGYFKHPRRPYACDGVTTLFRTLAAAADDLRRDLAAADRSVVEPPA